MNRAEHIRQMRAIAKSHMLVSMTMMELSNNLSSLDAVIVAYSHHRVCTQMIEDQERCEAFAVEFWHRFFHRNIREHGER